MSFNKLAFNGSGAGGKTHFPFEISTTTINGQLHVKVRPGTLNSLLPVNMFDVFPISDTGTFYVTLDIDSDGDSVTRIEIDVDSEYPDSLGESAVGVAPEYFQIMLGLVVNKKSFNVIKSSIYTVPQETIRTLSDDAQPGKPYYDINYTWLFFSI